MHKHHRLNVGQSSSGDAEQQTISTVVSFNLGWILSSFRPVASSSRDFGCLSLTLKMILAVRVHIRWMNHDIWQRCEFVVCHISITVSRSQILWRLYKNHPQVNFVKTFFELTDEWGVASECLPLHWPSSQLPHIHLRSRSERAEVQWFWYTSFGMGCYFSAQLPFLGLFQPLMRYC